MPQPVPCVRVSFSSHGGPYGRIKLLQLRARENKPRIRGLVVELRLQLGICRLRSDYTLGDHDSDFNDSDSANATVLIFSRVLQTYIPENLQGQVHRRVLCGALRGNFDELPPLAVLWNPIC